MAIDTVTQADVNPEVARFGQAIDTQTVERMEEGASSNNVGQIRRMTLVVMHSDSDTLIKIAKESPEVFEEMGNAVLDFREHAKALLEVADAASVRICFAYDAAHPKQ